MTKINQIYTAIEKNNLAELRALLDNDDASYYSRRKGNPLLAAVKAGHITIVEYLLKREGTIFRNIPSKHKTALRSYNLLKPKTKIERKRLEALKNEIFEKHGFNLPTWHQIGSVKQNPLIEAIKKENIEMVNAMIKSILFSFCSFTDENGNTPLHYVDKIKDDKKRTEIATLLITRGMDITLKNNKGAGVVHLTAYQKIQEEVLAQLKYSFFHDIAETIFFSKTSNALIFSAVAATICLAASSFAPMIGFGALAAVGYSISNMAYVYYNDRKQRDRTADKNSASTENKIVLTTTILDSHSKRIDRIEQFLSKRNVSKTLEQEKVSKKHNKREQLRTKQNTFVDAPAFNKQKQKTVDSDNSPKDKVETVKGIRARR